MVEQIIRIETEHFKDELVAIQNCLVQARKFPEDREVSLNNAEEYVAEMLSFASMPIR